jgi:hypothetical protein
MRIAVRGILAFAFVAALTLTNSAGAAPVLNFSQSTPAGATELITGTNSGGAMNLTTSGPVPPGNSITVAVTQIGTTQISPAATAFETFTLVRGTGTATTTGTTVSQDTYSGTIVISSLAGGLGQNILTATFSNGLLSGNGTTTSGPVSVGLTSPTVSYTSANPTVIAALGGASVSGGSFAISITGITPALTTSGGVLSNFTSNQNSGVFNITSAVPEPASIVMARLSVFAGLGYGFRRRFTN